MPTEEEYNTVEKRLDEMPGYMQVVTLSGTILSKDQARQEVRERTPLGDLIVESQLEYLKSLKR
jgi:hypothetical protein